MKIDPDAPAFPNRGLNSDGHTDIVAPGLTIRAHFAAMAMQGLLSNAKLEDWAARKPDAKDIPFIICDRAVEYADRLIEALNNTEQKGSNA